VSLDGDIAGGELPLIDVEEFEVLLEHEDMFGAVVAGEGRDDLGFGRATPIVAMRGQLMGIAVPGHDVPEDAQTGQNQGFLHALDETTRALNQGGAVPEIPAQGDDAVGGTKAPPQEAEDVEVAEPFAVRDITLAAGEVFHVTRVDEDHLEAAGVEDLEDGDPVDARGFHGRHKQMHLRGPMRSHVFP
jgi:hypothetical protein